MSISSATAFPQRLSQPFAGAVAPPQPRESQGPDRVADKDADDAVTRNARQALERPTPPAPTSRAPLAEVAGQLVDKLI